MPPQAPKPPDLDDDFNPIQPPDLDDTGSPMPTGGQPPMNMGLPPTDSSFLGSLYDNIFQAPEFITKGASNFAESLTPGATPQGGIMDAFAAIPDVARNMFSEPMATMKGFLGGATEGAASQLSPANIATLGKGRLPQLASQVLGGAQALHGAGSIMEGDIGGGLTEIGFGGMGMTPMPKGKLGAIADNVVGKPSAEPPITAESFGPGFFHKDAPPVTPQGQPPMPKPVKPVPPPLGTDVVLSKQRATPENVKRAKEEGFEFMGVNEDGSFKFKRTSEGTAQPVLESEVPLKTKGKKKEPDKPSMMREMYELPRALMSIDPPFVTSAMFRQGLPMIGTKNWFKSAINQARAFGSESFYNAKMNEIKKDPLFVPRSKVSRSGTKKKDISYADEIGLKTTDLSTISAREEALRSQLAEKIPVYGKYIRASNRAYTLFLNDLRRNQLNDLVKSGQAMAKASSDDSLDPLKNLHLGRSIAEFINDATGRSSLKTYIPLTGKEINLERSASGRVGRSAKLLTDLLFSPRLMASRIRMLNPSTYTQAPPMVRKEYLKALARTVGSWWGIAGLAEMSGVGEVSKDSSNADFGKIKIGNTRIDPGGGFQQFLVLGSRLKPEAMHVPMDQTGITPIDLMTGLMSTPGNRYTSSGSGEVYPLGEGYKPETRTSISLNFLSNKLHPTAKLLYDIGSANEQIPVHLGDRIAQLYLPMMTGDLTELAQEDPELIPLLIPLVGGGMGSQTYTGEPGQPSITPFIDQVSEAMGMPLDLQSKDVVLGR